jgi:hypothetical protein
LERPATTNGDHGQSWFNKWRQSAFGKCRRASFQLAEVVERASRHRRSYGAQADTLLEIDESNGLEARPAVAGRGKPVGADALEPPWRRREARPANGGVPKPLSKHALRNVSGRTQRLPKMQQIVAPFSTNL